MGTRRVLVAGSVALIVAASAVATAQAEDSWTLGPDGYKALRLHQPEQAAERTGLLVDKQADAPCHLFHLRAAEGQTNVGSGVFVDPGRGVVMIGGTVKSHTPEGISIGSSLAEVRAAYPALATVPPMSWVYRARVEGRTDARYRFAFDDNNQVADFALESTRMGTCG
ncbi:hypothetical protein SAMN05216266_12738 [Amycolatopsis marina]|uniref:Uncharacterized protein n=1 Tax=Amycolatopsis marina TaxID=490629 RepID=A0A1I1CEK3_9PSEU|nr:hypothetical protein [Amycolatopsis marina]SFB61105.1 hypothetical protein SAMN05216266_12738 [Amycolatopsis marina]